MRRGEVKASQRLKRTGLACLLLCLLLPLSLPQCGSPPVPSAEGGPILPSAFAKYSGNPILTRTPGEWDHYQIGTGSVIKDGDTYYQYYHGSSPEFPGHLQLGLATATSPEGPYEKFAGNPILTIGKPGDIWGDWDGESVTRPRVVKFRDTYYMWFQGQQRMPEGEGHWRWRIGLATAPSPEGPWTKHEGNPVLGLGSPGEWDCLSLFLGSVVKFNDKYYLWYTGFDVDLDRLGDIGLATASSPEGPWVKYAGNPILSPQPGEQWNVSGLQEPMVIYHQGLFHMWVAVNPGGEPPGVDPLYADIGYYYSQDGIKWQTALDNPVLLRGREEEWDDINVSEPFAVVEGNDIYLFYMGFSMPPIDTSSIGLAIGRFE